MTINSYFRLLINNFSSLGEHKPYILMNLIDHASRIIMPHNIITKYNQA